MSTTARNVLIVLVLATAVFLSTAAAAVAGIISLLLRIGLLAGFVYFGWTIYRQNREQIGWLPDRQKALLYGAAALLALVLLASFFWTNWTPVAAILFFALVGGLGFVVYRIWQDARRYY